MPSKKTAEKYVPFATYQIISVYFYLTEVPYDAAVYRVVGPASEASRYLNHSARISGRYYETNYVPKVTPLSAMASLRTRGFRS